MSVNLQSGADLRPLLSIVIPVFNERETIHAALDRVRALQSPELHFDIEIVVVDDACTDGTSQLLEQERNIRLLRHAVNQGKGAAIRTALAEVRGEVIAIQDADLEYNPADLIRLAEPIFAGLSRVVYGSRFLAGRPKMELPNYLCNRLLALMANLLFGARITDEATCYKVFEAVLLKSIPLTCTRFEFCPEVTAKVRRRGVEIAELPIEYSPSSYDSGKKIRWQDGVVAIWTLLKYRFTR